MTNPTDPTDPNAQQPVAPAAPAQPVQPVQSAPQYAAPAQPAPQAPGQYSAPQYVAGPKTNTLSIIALVSAFVLPSIVPIVLGHISLSQIKKTGENGRGMALAATILGYVELAVFIIWIIAVIILVSIAATTGNSTYSTY